MLDLLRKNSRSFIVYLMFAIIIVVFAFTFGAITPDQACGGGSAGPYQVADLVKVNGETIDTNKLNMADELSYSPPAPNSKSPNAGDAERYYRQTRYGQLGLYGPFSGVLFGRAPSEISPIKMVKLLDELVETQLMADYGREMGMSVTNEEMSDRLALLVENFKNKESGEFDESAWLGFLRNQLNATPSAFEDFVKEEVLRERVIQLLAGGISATEAEVAARHRLTEEKVKVEYVTIDKRTAKALVPIADAEVKTWLTDNQDKAQAKYDELKATKYTTPKRWTLRGLKLDAVDPESADATEEQKEELVKARAEIKTKAEALKTEIDAALAAAKAAPTEPTPAPAVEDGAEPAPAPVVEPVVPGAVFGKFATERSDDDATKGTGGLFAAPFDAQSLARPPFGVPVIAAVTTLETGGMTDVVEVADGFWLFFADKIDDAVTQEYGDVAMEIARDIMRDDKVEAHLEPLAAELLAAAKKDGTKPLADAVKAVNEAHGVAEGEGLRAAEAMPFARLSSFGPGYPLQLPYIFGIGKSPEIVRAAFAATAEAPLLDQVFTVEPDGKRVVARFVEGVAAADLEDEARDSLLRELTLDKQRTFYRAWYEDYLDKKKKDGDVAYTDAWVELRKQAVDAYRSSGGVMPNDVPPAPAAAEEAADAPAKGDDKAEAPKVEEKAAAAEK